MARKNRLGHKSQRKLRTRRAADRWRAASLGLERLEERAMLAAGSLDTTFDPIDLDGVLVGDFGIAAPADVRLNAVATLANGKIIAAGTVDFLDTNTEDVIVAQFNADGSLDTAFGTGGYKTFDFSTGQSLVDNIAIDSDGNILVVGTGETVAGFAGWGVARLTDAGVLDTTFDVDGRNVIQWTDPLGNVGAHAHGVAIDSSNRVVVVGDVRANSIFTGFDFGIVRYNTNGSLDASFGTGGRVTTDFFGRDDFANELAIQSNGFIVVAGSARTALLSDDFALARYDASGVLDSTFDADGLVNTNFTVSLSQDKANSVTVQADGKIVVAGSSEQDFAVARYTSAGTLDTTFGPSGAPAGTQLINYGGDDIGRAVAIQVDDQYIIGGTVVSSPRSNNEFGLARLDNNNFPEIDGSLDTTFGTGGKVNALINTYLPGATDGEFMDMALQADGKIVVVGWVNDAAGNEKFVIARYETGVVAPIAGPATVNEGAIYTLTTTSSDPTTLGWTIDWGDGNVQPFPGNPASVTHTYADGDNNYTISATVTTTSGVTPIGDTVVVTVNNVDPTLTVLNASVTVNEGSAASNSGTYGDVPADTVSVVASVGMVSASAGVWTWSYTPTDNAPPQTVTITATDEDGGLTDVTFQLNVDNVAPTLAISGAATVDEGSVYTLSLSESDPGADTVTSWTINWGDGPAEVVSGNPASVTHTYADGANNYTISATATDEDGTFAAGNTVAVTVDNVVPTLAIIGAATVNEGSTYTLNLSSSDPGTDTITSWTINWGDGPAEVVSGNPTSVTHVYADGNSGSNYNITATATDEDGTFAAGSGVAVTVLNVAPTADAGGPYATFDDTPIVLTGSGTDPAGVADPLTYLWDLDGDNIFGETGGGATRGNEVGASVTYNPIGLPASTQTVKLQVSDGDGGVTVDTATVQITTTGTILVGSTLYIVGSNSSDIVAITKFGSCIIVLATFNSNNPVTFNSSAITDIQVRMRGGNDIVVTTSNVTQTMTIDGGTGKDLLTGGGGHNVIIGGDGNDILYGASGNDVLLGGAGNDDLIGGSGNDVLVGGSGNDVLLGGSGRDVLIGSDDDDCLDGGSDEDILIGGITIHDSNVSALDAVMAIWGSSASFSSRVATLTASGGLLQAGVAVFDDDDNDTLVGGAGRDLYFGDNNPWDGNVDSIALNALQDQLIAVT